MDHKSLISQGKYYSSLFMNHPDAIYLLDLEGKFCDVNPTALKYTGYSLEEMLQLTFHQLTDYKELDKKSRHFNLCKQGITQRYQTSIINKNKDVLLVDITNIPIFDGEEVIAVYGIARDITEWTFVQNERRLLREGLVSAEQELRDTLQKQQGMTFKFKKIGDKFIHTMVAGKLLHLLGCTEEQIIGKEVWDFMPIDLAKEKEKHYHRAWNGEENVDYESTLGQITYFASMSPIRKGEEVVEVVASCVDISKLKKTEEALRSVKNELESFIDSNADAIAIYDKNGRIVRINSAFEQMMGWSYSEVIRLSLEEQEFIPEHLKEEVKHLVSKIKLGLVIKEYETVRRTKAGHLINVTLTLSPIYDGNGVIDGWSIIIRDITERKRTEELLARSEKLTMVGQLAAGIGHEIRNPLTTLKGFVQLMEHTSGSQPRYLEVMRSELERIEMITNELLLLAKPQSTQFKETSLLDIVQEVIILLEPQANMSSIRFELEAPYEIPYIECDKNQIKQVFINLLKNSIEAMNDGGVITIRIQVNTEEKRAHAIFIDRGCGISEEQVKKLGEPFYTTKEKGTGLGMLVSYKIIENHNGFIQISSEVNVGTTIQVNLPLLKTEHRK